MAFTVIARRRNCRGVAVLCVDGEARQEDKTGGREVVALEVESKRSTQEAVVLVLVFASQSGCSLSLMLPCLCVWWSFLLGQVMWTERSYKQD